MVKIIIKNITSKTDAQRYVFLMFVCLHGLLPFSEHFKIFLTADEVQFFSEIFVVLRILHDTVESVKSGHL